jgi:hypothetical protein
LPPIRIGYRTPARDPHGGGCRCLYRSRRFAETPKPADAGAKRVGTLTIRGWDPPFFDAAADDGVSGRHSDDVHAQPPREAQSGRLMAAWLDR